MKVIDLLNKIANGEEVPKEIKYRDWLYEFEKDCNDYLCQFDSLLYRENDNIKQFLNDEIEIIEDTPKVQVEMTQEEYNEYLDRKLNTPKEDKKIKRIQSNGESLYSEYIGEWLIHKERYTEYDELLMNKINEIIDRLNESEVN